jgi:hypothetical protein
MQLSGSIKVCSIIFSKDRPLQLFALLETMESKVIDQKTNNCYVLFKATTDKVKKYYRKVKAAFPQVIFVQETNFKQNLCTIVSNPFFSHVLFIVDDSVFLKSISLNSVCRLLTNKPHVIGFSLRLGTNVTYCYTQKKNQSLPKFAKKSNQTLLWNWNDAEYDFGYPLEVSSSVYRLSLLRNLCHNLMYDNPNTLEHQMSLYAQQLKTNFPWLMSFKESHCISIPMNLTQSTFKNRHSKNCVYGVSNLLDVFGKNLKINTNCFNNIKPNSPHVEISYNYCKRSKPIATI